MNKVELDIAMKIAEIEGKKLVFSHNGGWYTVGTPYGSDDFEYNPFDWRVLGALMYKYDVCIDRYMDDVCIESEWTGMPPISVCSFSSEDEMKEAILQCIIEAQEK